MILEMMHLVFEIKPILIGLIYFMPILCHIKCGCNEYELSFSANERVLLFCS